MVSAYRHRPFGEPESKVELHVPGDLHHTALDPQDIIPHLGHPLGYVPGTGHIADNSAAL